MAVSDIRAFDFSEMVDDKKELRKWAALRKRFKNPDDYVSIRHGFTHLAYAHARHQGPSTALVCELTGLQPEEVHVQSIKTVDKKTGVAIKVDQHDLSCICCEENEQAKSK